MKSAFRLLPIHPDDWSLLGVHWQSKFYVDLYLPFGLRSAPPKGPLFYFQSGRLLTRSSVICLLRDAARHAGLPYHSLKGHSFRIGAASTAAAAGLPDWLIKAMGRWSSDCYQLYIRTPQQVLLSAAPTRLRVSVAVKSAQRLLQASSLGLVCFFFMANSLVRSSFAGEIGEAL